MGLYSSVENLFPTSFAQQRLWFLDQLDPGNAAYNLARVIRIVGALDVSALTAAIQALVCRHDGLRTVFTSINDEPFQSVLPALAVDLPIIDLSALSEGDSSKKALQVAGEEARKPFDLTSGPLLRVTLVQLGREEHILVLVMHHIITDGWSMSVFFRELADLYEGFVNGRTPELPALTVRYSDFAQWQREYVRGELLTDQIDYWKKKLQGSGSALDLSTDHPRAAIQSGRGASERFFLNEETTEELKRLGRSEDATLFMTLLAAFQTLLWRYTSQATVLVGAPVAGRNEVELEALIGFFVNTLILRADFSDDPSVQELLRQVRSTALEGYAHQDVPFQKLVEELKPERTLSRTPLFQAMLILQNAPRQKLELQGLVLEEIEFESGIAKFDLTLEVIESEGLHCTLEYNTDLFDSAAIKRMIGHFETLIGGFIQHPDLRVSALQLLTEREREQILVDWNNTAADYPKDVGIHTAFEQQAARTPQGVAFLYEGNHLTYQQLNERANRLAHYLIHEGVTPGDLVGISIERSLEVAVGLLGILKAGAAYVPIDPSEPKQRLALMLEDSKVGIIVSQNNLNNRLPQHRARLLFLDTEKAAIDEQSAMNPCVPLSPGDLAYVIYTSGSTGTPKGVEGTHRASMNRFAWMWNAYPFCPGETCCQKTALSFIDSVWEIFGPLLRGIRNVIIPKEALLDPEQFVHLLAEYEVSRIVLVPSLLRVLLDHFSNLGAEVPKLKLWSASGEVLTAGLARRFLSAFTEATLLNIYGCSEVAADVTWHEIEKISENRRTYSIPIGRPVSNTQIYILDSYLNPVPIGVRGEIHVGGVCLARGYWNKPDTTAERFISNPFEHGASTRLYKTGDFGRFLPDGTIEYLGRADNQLKIRGFRIELGEVESVLRSHPMVREAVVIVQGEQQKLVAYVVPSDGPVPVVADLRRFAQSKLPEHMVPTNYAVVESLQVLPSGKVDRQAVPALDLTGSESDSTYVAPRTEIEETLANIWCDLLEVQRIGIEDNFFELGGHSLLAIRTISRIRKIFDVEVSVRSIFEEPIIARLAETVAKAKATGRKASTPILTRRTATDNKATLIAQLEKLSPDEVRALLDDVNAKKSSAQPDGS
jgi:amino acid adenylation domain-containing protein